MPHHLLHTGQTDCYDAKGRPIRCDATGQDGEHRSGSLWLEPRFAVAAETVLDRLTELVWSRDANPAEFPLTWQESFDLVRQMNEQRFAGYNDWRLPNRNELRSLVSYQEKKPALPRNHPFNNVFLGWYWSSTTAAIQTAYAWSVHMEGARMFYGRKDQYQLCWPVRGHGNGLLPATGQRHCFDTAGNRIPCPGTGQDGELQQGSRWPHPRFSPHPAGIRDRLTGLVWHPDGDLTGEPVSWQAALDAVARLNAATGADCSVLWRLPNINELASLVDCAVHSPALSQGHPFTGTSRQGYWSSTTSLFETDWAWVLYLDKGACGVGYKPGADFHVWPVTEIPGK